MPYKDPEAKRAAERAWRKRKWAEDPAYRERKQATDRAWVVKVRKALREYKLQQGCHRCEYRRCADALHFHHRDASGKELTIGDAIRHGQEKVWLEVAKCDVVCANCHAEIHAGL